MYGVWRTKGGGGRKFLQFRLLGLTGNMKILGWLKWFENDTAKITMVWSCEKGNGGRSAEIRGGNGSIRENGSGKTKENLERYSEEGFGTNRSGRESGIGSRKIVKDHCKSDPCMLEGKTWT